MSLTRTGVPPRESEADPGSVDAGSYSDIELAAAIEVTGNAIAVLSGVLAYVVVDRASERQQARASRSGDP